jgi:hypothetical protein
MTPPATPERYKYHRFPAEIISHGVWLYYRFCLSYRDVEELLFVRGILVTYEAIRKWCRKFGQAYANQLRRRRPRPGDKWHLDVRRVIDPEECKSLPGLWECPVRTHLIPAVRLADSEREGGV